MVANRQRAHATAKSVCCLHSADHHSSTSGRIGIRVGPWIFEWGPSALCIPMSAATANVVLDFVVGTMTLGGSPQLMAQISAVVTEWNTTQDYSGVASSIAFARALLRRIGCEWLPASALDKYVEGLGAAGELGLEYIPGRAARAYLGDAAKVLKPWSPAQRGVLFQTHTQLDQFYNLLRDDLYNTRFREDWYFLKRIDGCFWRDEVHSRLKCPFGRPGIDANACSVHAVKLLRDQLPWPQGRFFQLVSPS